jgi:hypothetical protein
MPISFANPVQELTYRKVREYLSTSDLFKDTLQALEDRPKFELNYGSTRVSVGVLTWEVNPWDEKEVAIVRANSCVTVGTAIDSELTEYLLRENLRMRFGAFQIGEENQIFFAHNVLGGANMDLMELQTCILSVVTIADIYDDIITEKFGGQRARDLPARSQKSEHLS